MAETPTSLQCWALKAVHPPSTGADSFTCLQALGVTISLGFPIGHAALNDLDSGEMNR
jgi:hypothetical protein